MCIHGFSCLSMKSNFVVNRTKPCCVRRFYVLHRQKRSVQNKIHKIQRQFLWSISALCYVAAQSASAMVWLCCSRTMPNSFQNRVQQYRFSFAFTILCISFLHMSSTLSADNAPPPQRIIAYVCMNPKCDQSFTNLFSYDQHRYHSRNVGTLCASLTMRREIVATRRAGVTTAVVKRIPATGMQYACICASAWRQHSISKN